MDFQKLEQNFFLIELILTVPSLWGGLMLLSGLIEEYFATQKGYIYLQY
jgi:hypothetical protein